MSSDDDMANFIGLSAVLTGFNKKILDPNLDPVNIKSQYLPFFVAKVTEESGDPTLVGKIFSTYANLANRHLEDEQIGRMMLNPGNGADWESACRKLIFMWYSGAWPTVNTHTGTTDSNLISAESYTSGLVWQVMQSHPMGDSNYRYGYWAKPPVPLRDYTGN